MPETFISAFIEYLKFCLVKGFTGITKIKIERYTSRKINLRGKIFNFCNQCLPKVELEKKPILTREHIQNNNSKMMSSYQCVAKKAVLAIGNHHLESCFLTIMKVGENLQDSGASFG